MLQCLGKRAGPGCDSWELSSNRGMDGSSWTLQRVLLSRQGLCPQLTQLETTLWSEKNPHRKVTSTEKGQSKEWRERWTCPQRQQECRLESWVFRNAPVPIHWEHSPGGHWDWTSAEPDQNNTKHLRHLPESQASLFASRTSRSPSLLRRHCSSWDRIPRCSDAQIRSIFGDCMAFQPRLPFWCRMWVSFCSLSCKQWEPEWGKCHRQYAEAIPETLLLRGGTVPGEEKEKSS